MSDVPHRAASRPIQVRLSFEETPTRMNLEPVSERRTDTFLERLDSAMGAINQLRKDYITMKGGNNSAVSIRPLFRFPHGRRDPSLLESESDSKEGIHFI